jgi:hypothetical protein
MAVRAVESGIRRLYHYETFDPEYLKDTLVSRHVHVSNPQHFNDPWDCYPCLDTTRATDPVYRASCVDAFRQFPIPSLTAAQQRYYESGLQADSRLFTEMLTEFRESIRNMVVDRWRTYCLTPHSGRPLILSHYSNNHQAEHGCRSLADLLPDAPFRQAPDVVSLLQQAPRDLPGVRRRSGGDRKRISSGVQRHVTGVERHAPGLPVKRAVRALDRYSLSIQE